MAKLSKDNSVGTLHPRENQIATGNLASNNAEIVVESHGNTIAMLDLRGTFAATVDLQGTVDGTNWQSIPMRPYNEMGSFQFGATAVGTYWANVAGFRVVKAKIIAYTSGTAVAFISAALGEMSEITMADNVVTATGVASAAVTATIPASTNLTNCVTHIEIVRYAAAAQTASGTPTIVTTTGLPGSLAWTIPHEAAAQGSIYEKVLDFTRPVRASADSTAVTITCPAITGIIWRVTITYFMAP